MPADAKNKGRTLPHNLEAEQSVLSCFLIDGDKAAEFVPRLDPDDFYSEAHKRVFSAMQKINRRAVVVDLSTLTDQLERDGMMAAVGGMNYLVSLSTFLPSSANYRHYHEIVERNSAMRKLILSCTEIIEDSYSSEDAERTVSLAEKKIFDINQKNLVGSLVPLKEGVREALDRIQRYDPASEEFKGIMTGFTDFDKKTNGFQKGNLIILAATTGVGKSAMAVNIIENAGKNGKTVAYFSLEMPTREIAQRLVSSFSGVSMSKLTTGMKKSSEDWSRLWDASDLIYKMEIFVDDSSLTTPAEIRSKCLRLKAQQGLDLVVIDYLQLMSLSNKKTESRQLEIAEITRNLKIIAKELDIPILALSQLSREAAKRNVNEGKEPVLSDLRESGAIEQDADMVLFIYKKHDDEKALSDAPAEVELIVAKNRNGPTFKMPLTWIGELVRFVNFGTPYKPGAAKTETALEAPPVDEAPLPSDDEAPPLPEQ